MNRGIRSGWVFKIEIFRMGMRKDKASPERRYNLLKKKKVLFLRNT
jgi:hypothetical protein